MADITEEELRKEINAILKDADLRVMSAKKVRQQLEEKLSCNLVSRKEEIDEMVMAFVNSKEEEEDASEEEEEEEEEETKPAKRPAPKKPAAKAKKAKADSSDEGEESKEDSEGSDDEDDYPAKKPVPKKKAAPKKRGKGSGSDSDQDWKKGDKPKKSAGRGKGGGYTRAYKLSPQLAALMGQESMARHEVVKKVWAMIKEKQLYDPGNKQFAICDDDLYKVMGVKRFRTFGMMKYLKTHFHD